MKSERKLLQAIFDVVVKRRLWPRRAQLTEGDGVAGLALVRAERRGLVWLSLDEDPVCFLSLRGLAGCEGGQRWVEVMGMYFDQMRAAVVAGGGSSGVRLPRGEDLLAGGMAEEDVRLLGVLLGGAAGLRLASYTDPVRWGFEVPEDWERLVEAQSGQAYLAEKLGPAPPVFSRAQFRALEAARKELDPCRRVIGESVAFWRAIERVAELRDGREPVLFTGEAGVGKRELMRLLSGTSSGVRVLRLVGGPRGCSAVTVGAGDVVRALDAGVVEILGLQALAVEEQGKLGRAIREHRVGSGRLLATADDVEALHPDLRHVFGEPVHLSPLRERPVDIVLLALGVEPPMTYQSLFALMQQPWTQNVRELLPACEAARSRAKKKGIKRVAPELLGLDGSTRRGPKLTSDVRRREVIAILAGERTRLVGEHGAQQWVAELLGVHRSQVCKALAAAAI